MVSVSIDGPGVIVVGTSDTSLRSSSLDVAMLLGAETLLCDVPLVIVEPLLEAALLLNVEALLAMETMFCMETLLVEEMLIPKLEVWSDVDEEVASGVEVGVTNT